ncbi:DUF6263 family protein [Mucilaginibacter myungsuensis]|uniref:TlpA family protein disulfide reductase n=1 Tax=Mucilaginibacter myungsuensis TaxID=649104 RepID=A0A929KV78_9SPHI|nr:DUF6263 family protein [Mucilaginibacter myungsuensis]MBE9660503.1 TlpA family protein disulfide reductase [Mucilaginibacter myungsuensis]
MTKLLTSLFLIAAAVPCLAQELNVPKGKEFSYTTQIDGTGTQKYNTAKTYNFRSLGKDADGNSVFECTLIRIVDKQDHDRDGKPSINSDNAASSKFNSTSIIDALAILNKPFKVTVDKEGKVLKVDGADEAAKAAGVKWDLDADTKNRLISHTQFISSQIQQMFFWVPGGITDKTATEWKAKNGRIYKVSPVDVVPNNLNLNTEVKKPLDAPNNDQSLVRITTKANDMTNELAEYIIDTKTGLVQTSTKKRDMTLHMSSQEMRHIDKTEQKIGAPAKPVQQDTTVTDMMVQMGSFSDAMQVNRKYDLDKMQRYFKANDAKFNGNPYYHSAKLGAIQQLPKSDANSALYDSLLLATPSKYLYIKEGLHTQLINKFYKLSETDPEKAYEVAQQFYDTDRFREWVQTTTAQTFLSPSKAYPKEWDIALKLVTKMYNAKEPILKKEFTPLYLWATARKDTSNTALLMANAKQLAAADKQTFRLGMGGRYGLLLYGMLEKAGKPIEAKTMLDATITKLHNAATDSTNVLMVDDKYTLAHAYYLKYLAEKKRGNLNAPNYLSLAAQNSPSGPNDKTYARGYDSHFLKSKPSYREDHIQYLLSIGDERKAAKSIAAHISAEPESLPQMKKLYQGKYPDKDFKMVFMKDVVGSWPNAPDFNLLDLENRSHSLTEYLNKWTVIDFWGTWCGPCVAELPDVNGFYQELATDDNASFVSIACKDFTQTVIPFMKKNDYSFPVLMSDGKIQQKFLVRAYPHKVLVSPSGKFIPIEYGKDWRKILKTFSSI